MWEAARHAIVGLAETVSWDSPADYDVVLETLDTLHAPLDPPLGECEWDVPKRALYDLAHESLTALAAFGIPAGALRVCRNLLDVAWATDPDHEGHRTPSSTGR
ncbi:hypothetical protein [Isoptericola sp. NPDC019482]|uniref:hypothetical protein n=1 Tax=Isoptericola sp. NPDC019482 TaxID=3154688 RepID=UPI0034723404